jgi:short-subunit dehydrogenase
MDRRNTRTALITGASSGIGEEFARQLAHQGYNLILVARRQDRLKSLASELRAGNGVRVEVLPADLKDKSGVAQVVACIAGTEDLALLVNNAGFGLPGRFHKSDIARQVDMIQVHVIAAVQLAQAAAAGMVQRGQGAIINVASLAAFIPLPGSATYSATKAYLVRFSEALQMELRGTGVRVQALCPGFTYSEFHDTPEMGGFRRSSLPRMMWMPAGPVVAASLRGLRGRQVVVVPGLVNQFVALAARSTLTRPIVHFVVANLYH